MEEREEIITLVDEEGEQFEFLVLDYFQVDDLDYAVLLPYAKDDLSELVAENWADEEVNLLESEGEAVIFRVMKGNNGETLLYTIEDEEEWDKVAEIAYERLLAEEGEED